MITIHTLNYYSFDSEELLMKLSELSTAVADVSTQLAKAQSEILGRIADLETALVDVELPADAVDALTALRAQTQSLDDIVQDVIPD